MRFYSNSNAGCLNWVKRPHGDSLGDAAQLGARASRVSFGEEQESVHVRSVLVRSKSSIPQFVCLFCPGVKYRPGYTVANLNPLNQLKSLINASSNPEIY